MQGTKSDATDGVQQPSFLGSMSKHGCLWCSVGKAWFRKPGTIIVIVVCEK